jgi:hypothetical protein
LLQVTCIGVDLFTILWSKLPHAAEERATVGTSQLKLIADSVENSCINHRMESVNRAVTQLLVVRDYNDIVSYTPLRVSFAGWFTLELKVGDG